MPSQDRIFELQNLEIATQEYKGPNGEYKKEKFYRCVKCGETSIGYGLNSRRVQHLDECPVELMRMENQ